MCYRIVSIFKLFLLCACLSVTFLFSESSENNQREIRGVVLISNPQSLITENLNEYCGVHFTDVCVPGNSDRFEQILECTLIGKSVDMDVIYAGEEAIVQFYRDNGHPLVLVYTPDQRITQGILQIVVIESRIGNICYNGNRWFPACQIQRHLHLERGCYYNSNRIQKDLIWLNRNPFRDTFLVLNPGEEEGTTDIDVCTRDHFPYRIFVGTDNTGFDATGRQRLFAGVNFGNLFQLDQSLSYQYTTSTDFGRFFAHTAQYKIPLPWRNLIDFYGGYSGIRAIVPLTGMRNQGRAWQASFRYLIPLCPCGCFSHEARFGIDYKRSDVNLVLDAIPILGSQTLITQVMLGYNASYQDSIADTSLEFQWFISPGDLFAHQSNSDYQTLRPFARSQYTYIRFATIPIFHLPRCWDAVVRAEFQYANENLLSSEQFGLGGLYTVRGYDERILNTDNAFLLSGEIRTPPMRIISKRYFCDHSELLQFLAFVDYGFGTNHKPLPGQKNFLYLLGVGLGARYYFSYNVSAKVNWGYPVHQDIGNGVTQRHPQFNYSVVLSF